MDLGFEETTFSFSSEAPGPVERRRNARHLTILRVGTLVVDGERELCLIRNISAGGLMAHVYSQFSLGQRVAVELKANQAIAGTVSWISGGNIGISFAAPIDVEDLLASSNALERGWRPRLPRVEVDRMGTLRAGARTHWVSTRDISQGGVKLETDQPLEPGQDVVVALEDFRPVAGVVRWSDGGLCGVSFNQVIPFGELMSWLRRPAAKGG
ncbi:MAG TPA: PilZ domain-containing protein [Allosphingosinicella sp.]|nr:PilZ domain-containing protein [Allosphingosinicella sp.]